MNINTLHHHFIPDTGFCHVVKSRNDLRIERIEYMKDKQRNWLILFLESNLDMDSEAKAFIRGNNLIIEALRAHHYSKPFRTHLIQQELLTQYELEGEEIRFSEVQLNKGFGYHVLSCQVANPRLLKVIVSYQPVKSKMKFKLN